MKQFITGQLAEIYRLAITVVVTHCSAKSAVNVIFSSSLANSYLKRNSDKGANWRATTVHLSATHWC